MRIRLIADNDLTRRMGLMGHTPLEEDECAYFYFKKAGKYSFWNNNVSFPISLIFCNGEGEIKDIKFLEPNQLNGVSSDGYDIHHVVEAHRDAPKNLGIEKGGYLAIEGSGITFKKGIER